MQGVGREIAEEARMLPERQARDNEAIKVRNRRGEILGLVRRRGGQGVSDLAGLSLGHHGPVGQVLVIVGQPVDQRMAMAAEVFRRHGRPCGLARGVRGSRQLKPPSSLGDLKSTGAGGLRASSGTTAVTDNSTPLEFSLPRFGA